MIKISKLFFLLFLLAQTSVYASESDGWFSRCTGSLYRHTVGRIVRYTHPTDNLNVPSSRTLTKLDSLKAEDYGPLASDAFFAYGLVKEACAQFPTVPILSEHPEYYIGFTVGALRRARKTFGSIANCASAIIGRGDDSRLSALLKSIAKVRLGHRSVDAITCILLWQTGLGEILSFRVAGTLLCGLALKAVDIILMSEAKSEAELQTKQG